MLATCVLERAPHSIEGSAAEARQPELARCASVAALRSWIQHFARDLGFYGARYVHIGHAAQAAAGAPARFLSTSPRDGAGAWLDCDPVAAMMRSAFAPFAWTTRAAPGASGLQREWLDGERGRGVHAGIAVPVQDHAAGPAYLSLFGVDEGGTARLLAERAPQLAFAGMQFHVRAKALIPLAPATQSRVELTLREMQCLELAAMGRTVPASASALEIAGRTVEFHLANAATKLRAVNKVHAVALAASERLILV